MAKTSSWHPRLIVEEMSQLAHQHILDIEQTFESEGESGNERGARSSPPLYTLAVCQEARYLSVLLLGGLVILKSCLWSYYF